MAVTYCGNDFCVPKKNQIDTTCHDLGQQAGKWIMYTPDLSRPNYQCYCICSCIGDRTPVTIADGRQIPIEEIVPGRTEILAAGKDLRFVPTVAKQKSAAPPAQTKQTIYIEYTVNGVVSQLVVTQSHPFFLHGSREVCAASRLRAGDKLIDRNGGPITITRILLGEYTGSFWEIATNLDPPDANYNGHLILTGGVVSGDFSIETYINYPLGDVSPALKDHMARPVVGSPEWRRANHVERGAAEPAIDMPGGQFLPASRSAVAVPAHASDFLPSWQAALLERPEVPKRPYNDMYSLDMCEWLIERVFQPLYPDVEFLFDWYSDEPNAHSWVTGDKKYVYLSGALARIDGFEYDGMSLALAHEIGHLYGKPDSSPSGVTCEGEADFYGASVVMRKLWFGERYFEFTRSAIAQVKILYAYIDLGDKRDASAAAAVLRLDKLGRAYPSNECRIRTWEAAMAGPDKPACADCGEV